MAGHWKFPLLTRLGVHTHASDDDPNLLPKDPDPIPTPKNFLKRPDVKVSCIRMPALLPCHAWLTDSSMLQSLIPSLASCWPGEGDKTANFVAK